MFGLICGCIPQYQITKSQSGINKLSNNNKQGISLTVLEDSIISYNRLAKRSERKNLQLLSFQIENATANNIVIDYQKIEAISTLSLELIPVLSPIEFYAYLKNKSYNEIIAGVLGGALMFSYSAVGLTFIPYSPTWLITVGAAIQLYRHKKINKQLLSELQDRNLQGVELLSGESKIGIISVNAESSEGLILRYSMK